MKKLITLTALTLLSTAAALTTQQRSQHVNQVASAAGFTLITCPSEYDKVSGYNLTCLRSNFSNSLFQQTWDLYSDWNSKVTFTAKHVSAWKANGSNVAAGFEISNDRYIVVFDDQLDIALIGWTTAANDAATTSSAGNAVTGPGSVPGAVLPARLNAAATPTRTGPFNLNPTSLQHELGGPVKTSTETTRKISDGTETVTNTTRTYARDGRLLASVTTDASGTVTAREDVTYDGTRMTRRVSLSDGKTTTSTYTYDPQGNLLTSSELDGNGQPTEITRYVTYPNGYSSQTFGKTGPATRTSYTLQDARSRTIRSENNLTGTWLISEYIYDGNRVSSSQLTTSLLDIIRTPTPTGTRSRSVWKGSTSLPSLPPTVYTNEQPDQYGNPTIKRQFHEVTEFGATTLKPTQVTTITYTYH